MTVSVNLLVLSLLGKLKIFYFLQLVRLERRKKKKLPGNVLKFRARVKQDWWTQESFRSMSINDPDYKYR